MCSLDPIGYQTAQRVVDGSVRGGSAGRGRPDQLTVLSLNKGRTECLAHVVELFEASMTAAGKDSRAKAFLHSMLRT